MSELLVQAILDPASGFSQEAAVNTFAFKTDVAVDAAVQLDIFNAVAQFYAGTPTGSTLPVGAYLSSMFSRTTGACQMKMYNISGHLDGSAAGSPIAVSTFTLPAAANTVNLPPQTACVVTLRARNATEAPAEGAGNTRPRQRLSGRLFIGGLNDVARATGGGVHARPDGPFRGDLMRSCETLQDSLVDGDYAWGVWSRTAQAVVPIVRVEVDDSFDVLRSRKVAPTTRSTTTFSPAPALILGA